MLDESVMTTFSHQQQETQTYNDMLRISLVSGLHTPRSSCSKLEMRATPDPAKIKIDMEGEKMRTKKSVSRVTARICIF